MCCSYSWILSEVWLGYEIHQYGQRGGIRGADIGEWVPTLASRGPTWVRRGPTWVRRVSTLVRHISRILPKTDFSHKFGGLFLWGPGGRPSHTGPSWSPAKSGGTLKDSWFQFQFQFRFQFQFQFRFQFQFSFSVSFSFSFGCSFSSVSVSVSVQFSLVFSVSFSLSSVSVSVQFRLGFLYWWKEGVWWRSSISR